MDTDFIYSQAVVEYLQTLGVTDIRKMIPAVNPCMDTISYAVSGEVLRMPAFWNALVIRFNTTYDIPALAYLLAFAFPEQILWAQPNFIYSPLGGLESSRLQSTIQSYGISPNDSAFGHSGQELLKSKYIGDAWIDSIWTYTNGDSTIHIGCVDGGFDWRHPDLGGGAGLGYRVRGSWNYISNTSNTYTGLFAHKVDHGTASLSVIGAISNNTIGTAGICGGDAAPRSGAAMYALLATNSAEVANAVWEASANTGNMPGSGASGQLWKCDILSFSMSTATWWDTVGLGYKDEIVRSIIAFRYQNGRTTFCAMGDGRHRHDLEHSDTTYAGAPEDVDKEWVITVSTGDRFNVACSDDFGQNLDILAPGSNAVCWMPSGKPSYRMFSQASGAAPVAAGIGGLLLSYFKDSSTQYRVQTDSLPPYLAPDDIEWILKHTSEAPSSARRTEAEGWGAVKGIRAVRALMHPFMLKHDSVKYSCESIPAYEEDTLKIVFPGWTQDTTMQPFQGSTDATYKVHRFHLTQRFVIDRGRLNLGNAAIERIWGRGGNSWTGYGNPIKFKRRQYRVPLYRIGWCAVVGDTAFDQNEIEMETYVYKAWQLRSDGSIGDSIWIPHRPDSIWFTYSILANANPPPVSLSQPPDHGSALDLDVFPQPAVDRIQARIKASPGTAITLRLFDIFGRELQTQSVTECDMQAGVCWSTFEIAHLAHGLYFVGASSGARAPVMRKVLLGRRLR